ncbi:hypothetical protein pb186bvf_004995 [Paramecium bursaria]
MRTIQSTVMRIEKVGYYQQVADQFSLENLYTIQVNNYIYKLMIAFKESIHSKPFQSYQFCYGIFGQKSFIALQNLLIPFRLSEQTKATYNLFLDQQIIFRKIALRTLKMLQYQRSFSKFHFCYRKKGQMLLIFNTIAGTKYLRVNSIIKMNVILYTHLERGIHLLTIIKCFENRYDIYGCINLECVLHPNRFRQLPIFKIKDFVKETRLGQMNIKSQVQGVQLKLIKQLMPDDYKRSKQTLIIKYIIIYFSSTTYIILQFVLFLELNKPLQVLQDVANFHINNQCYYTLSFMNNKSIESITKDRYIYKFSQFKQKTKKKDGYLENQLINTYYTWKRATKKSDAILDMKIQNDYIQKKQNSEIKSFIRKGQLFYI